MLEAVGYIAPSHKYSHRLPNNLCVFLLRLIHPPHLRYIHIDSDVAGKWVRAPPRRTLSGRTSWCSTRRSLHQRRHSRYAAESRVAPFASYLRLLCVLFHPGVSDWTRNSSLCPTFRQEWWKSRTAQVKVEAWRCFIRHEPLLFPYRETRLSQSEAPLGFCGWKP